MPQLCVPAVERAANELCIQSVNSLGKVSVRLQHFAVPYASLAVLSATQAKGALDFRDMLLPTPQGSVVVMSRRSAVNDEDLVEVADLSRHGTWIDEAPHEIIHDLVEVWPPLHTMSKGHEEWMTPGMRCVGSRC